jgi:hypothetical protein
MTDAYILGALIGFVVVPIGAMVYLFLWRNPEDHR